ncbi:MAG: hypothetical protein E6G97_06160 [Alphaproteobacteria bacterium]|nr:MAG: hypothetical protein E6G97_06160 [Alphaproteobacteria bacterium]
MPEQQSFTRARLRTPRAAAIAGILFSILLGLIFGLLRISLPADPLDTGEWLATSTRTVGLAINLVPFAGVAFLWFIGVLRDRLGAEEDRFFATVFLGSGILFLATLFAGAALLGSIVIAFANAPADVVSSASFRFARAAAYNITNIYAAKMAGVFMVSASTIVLQTRIAARWLAFAGFGGALALLLGSEFISWNFAVLPAWVLMISVYILCDNFQVSAKLDRWHPTMPTRRR